MKGAVASKGRVTRFLARESTRFRRAWLVAIGGAIVLLALVAIVLRGAPSPDEAVKNAVSPDLVEQKIRLQNEHDQQQRSVESTRDATFVPGHGDRGKAAVSASVDEFLKGVFAPARSSAGGAAPAPVPVSPRVPATAVAQPGDQSGMQSILQAINAAPPAALVDPVAAAPQVGSPRANRLQASAIRRSWSGDADEANSLFAGRRQRLGSVRAEAAATTHTAQKEQNPLLALSQKFIDQLKSAGREGPIPAGGDGERAESPPVILYNDMPPVRLYEGDWIDGVLTNKVIADTESSPLIVNVSKDMFDNDGRYVVIPAGTRVVGYSKVSSYEGAGRLFVWFERMILPNGVDVRFPEGKRSLAADQEGALGVVSSINRHFFLKFGNALMFGLIDGLAGFAQARANPDSGYAYFLERSANNVNHLTTSIFQQRANIVPTITVKAGQKIKVYMASDLLLSPYDLIRNRSYAR
jgi:type IV secretory pathway VirB10-like protein